jgi:hypothetical protein
MCLPLSSRMSMPLERCACGIHHDRNACGMWHKPHSGGMRTRGTSRSGMSNRGAACGMRHGDQSVRLLRQPILSQRRFPHQEAQATEEGHLTVKLSRRLMETAMCSGIARSTKLLFKMAAI